MMVEASLIFSSSDLPDGLLSRSIRARFSASAAAARRTYSSAFLASSSAASLRICSALGMSSSMPGMIGAFLACCGVGVRAKLGFAPFGPLIHIKQFSHLRGHGNEPASKPPLSLPWRRPLSEQLHPMAPHHLPFYLAPGSGTDVLMVVMGIFLVATVLWVGTLYWKLHSLPERMAHKSHKLQFEIVAVLGLISLFTHLHIFWVAGLLLAMIDLPYFGTPMRSIADSVERIADAAPGATAAEL